MKRFTTDHPSDPSRARIQKSSDECSRETMEEHNETFGVEMFLAKQAVKRAIDEYTRLDLTPSVGGRMLAALQDAQRRLELAVTLYDAWRPSHWGLEPKL